VNDLYDVYKRHLISQGCDFIDYDASTDAGTIKFEDGRCVRYPDGYDLPTDKQVKCILEEMRQHVLIRGLMNELDIIDIALTKKMPRLFEDLYDGVPMHDSVVELIKRKKEIRVAIALAKKAKESEE